MIAAQESALLRAQLFGEPAEVVPFPARGIFSRLAAAGFGEDMLPAMPGEKMPGMMRADGTWHRLKGWPDKVLTGEERERHDAVPDVGVCIKSQHVAAVDIDVTDAPLAEAIEEAALRTLGPAPCRTGRAPKRLLPYRAETPFNKITVRLRRGDDTALVEILGAGQQFVAYGTHPGTGKPYTWTRGDLVSLGRDGLTEMTQDTRAAFLEEVGRAAAALGYEIVSQTGGGVKRERKTAGAIKVDVDRARGRAVRYLEEEAPTADDPDAYRVACKVKDFGVDQATALELMREHWDPRCDPPRSDNTVDPVRNAYRYGREMPGVAAVEADFEPVTGLPAAERQKPMVLVTGTDLEIAGAVLTDLQRQHGEVLHDEGRFWRHDGKRWASMEETDLRRVLHSHDGKPYGDGRAIVRLSKGKLDSITHEMRVMAARPGFFANAPAGINCRSGFIVFSATGEPTLQPHAQAHRARHVLPGQWQPGATWRHAGSLLERLWSGCFRDDPEADGKVALLAEVFGAAALGYGTRLLKPKVIVLSGRTAENGKNQVIDAGRGLLPPDAVAAIPPSKFGDDHYTIGLAGKFLNVSGELKSTHAISSDAFKSIVTGDLISAREVYKPTVTFEPRALHLFAANQLPTFEGGFDRGVQRRLLVIPFNRTVPEGERVENIGVKIATEEPDLLLAFAVEGAARVIRQRFFTEPPSSRSALREWLFGADPVLGWFEERAEHEPGAHLPKPDAYHDFTLWAKRQGFNERQLPAINAFVGRVKAQDARISEARNNQVGRYFINLRLAEDAAEDAAALPATPADIFI